MYFTFIIVIEGQPLAKVYFDAVLSLWKYMMPRRIIVTERKEKNTYAQFITVIFFPFIVISGGDPPRHSEWPLWAHLPWMNA